MLMRVDPTHTAMPIAASSALTTLTCYFVRHGATEPNLRKLRCGGDLDVPLTDLGREQARATAQRIASLEIAVDTIVCSALSRTRETASIIAAILGIDTVVEEPLLNERRLGAWNLQPIAETEHLLAANVPPPGGEADEAFTSRILAGIERISRTMTAAPLIVGSKGVARVLNSLLGDGTRLALGNAEIATFALPLTQKATSMRMPA